MGTPAGQLALMLLHRLGLSVDDLGPAAGKARRIRRAGLERCPLYLLDEAARPDDSPERLLDILQAAIECSSIYKPA